MSRERDNTEKYGEYKRFLHPIVILVIFVSRQKCTGIQAEKGRRLSRPVAA